MAPVLPGLAYLAKQSAQHKPTTTDSVAAPSTRDRSNKWRLLNVAHWNYIIVCRSVRLVGLVRLVGECVLGRCRQRPECDVCVLFAEFIFYGRRRLSNTTRSPVHHPSPCIRFTKLVNDRFRSMFAWKQQELNGARWLALIKMTYKFHFAPSIDRFLWLVRTIQIRPFFTYFFSKCRRNAIDRSIYHRWVMNDSNHRAKEWKKTINSSRSDRICKNRFDLVENWRFFSCVFLMRH